MFEQAFLVCALPLCVGEAAGKDVLGTLCIFIHFPAPVGGGHGVYMNLMHLIGDCGSLRGIAFLYLRTLISLIQKH